MSALTNGRQYRIGEVAKMLGVAPHVIRYWETEFPVKPLRSKSGQRIYTAATYEKLAQIHKLLHVLRFTIEGARRYLSRGDGSEGIELMLDGTQ